MNLTIAEVRELPVAAALLDSDGSTIAATPEWKGGGPGTVSYAMRATRLSVATTPADGALTKLLDLLLEALGEAAGTVSGDWRLRVNMLAASLRVVAGRQVATLGTSHDVIDLALAGISARTTLTVRVEGRPAFPVQAPEVVALGLVQIAVNAERHTRTSSLTLVQEDDAFHVIWPGEAGQPELPTSRRYLDRRGWGLGFCRVAADTLGGVLHPPRGRGDGTVVATFELGLRDLALPLAAIRGHRVLKATRAWDEETGFLPGAPVEPGSRLAACLEAATASPGAAVVRHGWCSRLASDRFWVAIPPDDVIDRARDVLDGMAHERALWDGIGEPHRSRVLALASLLAIRLGNPLPRVPAGAWNRRMAVLAPALGLAMPIPTFRGLGALDPQIAAYLAAELGSKILVRGDDLVLLLRPGAGGDPRLTDLRRVGSHVRLS
ncbi:MAG: hypothetical protein WCB85_06485 [Candidatus Dormiibacterota bacterium]